MNHIHVFWQMMVRKHFYMILTFNLALSVKLPLEYIQK
jgi:hypothetical protein